MTRGTAQQLEQAGVDGINIGLHYPKQFDLIINNVLEATKNLNMTVRFHANDSFKYIEKKYSDVTFKFWAMDDCDRDNKDRVVLSESKSSKISGVYCKHCRAWSALPRH